MSKLNDQIKVLLDKVEDTELIQELVNLNNTANEIEKEHEDLLAKHNELKKSYKDAVMHSAFKQAPTNDPMETKQVSFEDLLEQYKNK